MNLSALALAGLVLALCGCATGEPQIAWRPRADANLAADGRACRSEAEQKNLNQLRDYGDGRYGAAAAMASRLNQQQGRYGAEQRLQDLIFEDCMTRKGWAKL